MRRYSVTGRLVEKGDYVNTIQIEDIRNGKKGWYVVLIHADERYYSYYSNIIKPISKRKLNRI